MPKTNESINTNLYELLQSQGFEVTMLTSAGEQVPVPQEADVFQFDFVDEDQDRGTVTITIDGLHKMIVYYNSEIFGSGHQSESWIRFLKLLKKFSQRNQLGFKLSNLDKLHTDMKKRDYTKKLEEGYYGTRQTSYSDNGPASIKMIIKHNRPLSETDARYRYVERIFLENELGERILVPSTKPSIGRVFARHLAEGGEHNDDRWHHIVEITEDIGKLGGFVRATKNRQFNEGVQQVVSEATNHYVKLKETVKRLQSHRGYNNYFESWKPALLEENNTDSLTEMFKSSELDPRIENAMSVLGKMNLYITESPDISVFEQWAEGVLGEALMPTQVDQQEQLIELLGQDSDYMAIGPDASNSIEQIVDLIQDDELFDRLRDAARVDTNRDARPIITAWMSEQPGSEYEEILDKVQPGSEKIEVDSGDTGEQEIDVKVDADEKDTNSTPPPPVSESDELLDIKRLSGF
jgi:hypothetical protein